MSSCLWTWHKHDTFKPYNNMEVILTRRKRLMMVSEVTPRETKDRLKDYTKRDKQEKNIELLAGLTKSALQSSGIRGFSFRESNFSFSLVQWARDQATRPPTKPLKGQTKTCPGQKKFEGFLSWGKLEFKFFLPYISKHIWTFPSACLIPVSIYLATVPATYKI